MLDKEEVKKICTEVFLIPYEGEGKKDAYGNFIAYRCPAGKPTIAWGLTFDDEGNDVQMGDVWDYDKALRVKKNVLDSFLNDLLSASPSLEDEGSSIRVAAILSWVYNLGIGTYSRSTFKEEVDNSDWVSASEECKKYNKARVNGTLTVLSGLVKRRNREAEAILEG